MAISYIVAFWAVSFLFVLTPGADWAYAVAAGLRYRSVVPAVAGLLCGHVVATALVAAGVAALVAAEPLVMTALTAVGAGYLVWLGAGMVARPSASDAGAEQAGGASWPHQVLKGAGVSGLNPKVFLLFLALLPQFVDPVGSWPIAAQISVLGLIHVCGCAIVYLAVGAGARWVLQAHPTVARTVTRVSGTAMVVIGLVLLGQSLSAL